MNSGQNYAVCLCFVGIFVMPLFYIFFAHNDLELFKEDLDNNDHALKVLGDMLLHLGYEN